MATISLTTVIGPILSAGAFIGGSYLAKDQKFQKIKILNKKDRMKQLKKYSQDYNEWKKKDNYGRTEKRKKKEMHH